MILAEKIAFLRKKNGWSQEELGEKLGISRQSVSKWESGASIPDLDKIIKMSGLFCVSTDYLIKDEVEKITFPEDEGESGPEDVRKISLEEANDYMDITASAAKKMAYAVSILILSPICLIQLAGLSEYRVWISQSMAGGVGIAVLLALAAAGVAILIFNGMKLSKYDHLETEAITLEYGVKGIVEMKKAAMENRHRASITVGVVLCILGIVPLMLAAALELEDMAVISCVNVLLAFAACGVHLMIRSGMIYGSYQKLLQVGDYTLEEKEAGKRLAFFPGAYWCIATAIYLGISFVTNRWDTSWIVWPVAGVLFAALYGVLKGVVKAKK